MPAAPVSGACIRRKKLARWCRLHAISRGPKRTTTVHALTRLSRVVSPLFAGSNRRLQPGTLRQRRGCRTDGGIVALPLATAFAIASRLKPQSGMRTAIIAGTLISAPGGSAVQISGATGAFIVIIYGILERSPDVWPAAPDPNQELEAHGIANLVVPFFWRHASDRDDCARHDRPTHRRDLPLSCLVY